MEQRKIDFFGIKYDHLVFFSIVAVVVQLFLDITGSVHFGIVFVYTLLPNISAPIPKYNHKLYKYNEYIPKDLNKFVIVLLSCVAFLLNCLVSGYVKYSLLKMNGDIATIDLIWDTLDKTWKWMTIHASVTACVVLMTYNAINKSVGINNIGVYKKRRTWLTVVSCLLSVLIMTPAGSFGYLFREKINNSAALTKCAIVNNSKEEKSPKTENNTSVSRYDSVSNTSTVVNNATVVNISTIVNNPRLPNNPIKAFIVDSLIITIASAILSASFVHCLLIVLDSKPRDFILRNLDKFVASIALLHISTGFVSAVGNFTKEHKSLLIIFSFIQFYILFLACFRVTLFIINRVPYNKLVLLDNKAIESTK